MLGQQKGRIALVVTLRLALTPAAADCASEFNPMHGTWFSILPEAGNQKDERNLFCTVLGNWGFFSKVHVQVQNTVGR